MLIACQFWFFVMTTPDAWLWMNVCCARGLQALGPSLGFMSSTAASAARPLYVFGVAGCCVHGAAAISKMRKAKRSELARLLVCQSSSSRTPIPAVVAWLP